MRSHSKQYINWIISGLVNLISAVFKKKKKSKSPSIQLHELSLAAFLATGLADWDAIDYVDCQHMPCTGEAESESLTLNKHGAAPGHPAL